MPQLSTDPRFYQMAIQLLLLIYGIGWLQFDIGWFEVAILTGSTLLTQYILTKALILPFFEPKSALISGLSLSLLIRAEESWLLIFAAVLTIVSKFAFRWQGKHLFNPSNFGIIIMMLCSGKVWVSTGQWGNIALFGFTLACCGGWIVYKVLRSDIVIAFLIFYGVILVGRALWLGDPLTIPLHQIQNGTFLLFSFFMISDPKMTPNSRIGRIILAFLVAIGAGFVQFVLFRTNGLLWSLAFFSLWIPLLDKWFPAQPYDWRT
jgi:enediyne biosynthesis protein E5